MATTLVRVQHRRNTATGWTTGNEVLLPGELGHETDTGKFKLGDGVTAWTALTYAAAAPAPTGVTAGTYGSATRVPITTVAADGRVTAISTVAVIASPGGTLPGVNVRDYGATGNGTTDDAAAFTAALAALTAGGTLYVPPGTYLLGSTVTINRPVQVIGGVRTGANPAWGTTIKVTATGVTAIAVNSDHVTFRDLAFACGVPAASLATSQNEAIRFDGGNYSAIDRCRFSNWWNAIHIEVGYGWMFRDCYVVSCGNYGILIRDTGNYDSGDQLLEGFQFDASMTAGYTPAAHIRYESGGGLKMVGNKLTNALIGVDLAVADGAATSILTMTGNSLENQTQYCVRLGRAGSTGTFSRVVIVGNQFSSSRVGAGNAAIQVNAGISETTINSNGINGNSGSRHVQITAGSAIVVNDNQGINGLIGLDVFAAASGVTSRGNQWTNTPTLAIDNGGPYTTPANDIEMRSNRYVSFLGNVTTFRNLWNVAVDDRDGGTIKVTLPGRVESGVAGFVTEYRRAVYRPAAGTAITVATIGTDTTSQYLNVQFDTTSNPGYVSIGVQCAAGVASAGGTGLSLHAVLECTGGGIGRVVNV